VAAGHGIPREGIVCTGNYAEAAEYCRCAATAGVVEAVFKSAVHGQNQGIERIEAFPDDGL
jgi:TPR repeat protein